MANHAIDDPVYTSGALEAAHGPYPAADLSECPLYGISVTHLASVRLIALKETDKLFQVCL